MNKSRIREPVDVELGYNQTHFQGAGDKLESLAQAFNSSISDFDLNTILMQMHDEVHTQKLLLVGHSQGTFYTNEIYKYLVTHGVSPDSVAVYNIATPASSVVAGGRYLTSSNDKAINFIRDTEVNGNVGAYVNSYYTYKGSLIESPLRANITIPKEDGWDTDDYGGHHFSVYMSGAGDRIVSDIDATLSKLKPSGNSEDCFTAPQPDIKYKMQAAAFTAGEPLLQAGHFAISTALSPINSLVSLGSSALAAVENTRGAFAGAVGGHGQTAGAAEAVDTTQQAAEADAPAHVTSQTNSPAQSSPKASATPNLSTTKNAVSEAPTAPQPEAAPTTPTPSPIQSLYGTQPGFGGGGGGAAPNNAPIVMPTPSIPAVAFSISTPLDNAFLATTSATFTGTADAGASVTLSEGTALASTTANSGGAWTLSQIFSEGTHALSFLASLAGETDSTVGRSLTVDTQAPGTTTISIAACSQSIATGFCALAANSTDVSWSAVGDADYYGVAINGAIVATTTSLSATVALNDNATSTIAAVSYDHAGNSATSSSVDVYAISRPLIINEIGWGGDLGFTTDIIRHSNQWIELRSLAPFAIDLSTFELDSSSNTPIGLTGSLSPRDPYGGIEVADQGVPAQRQVSAFTLATTSAEQLTLIWNGTTIDSTPSVSTCASWCAGAYEATLGSNVSGRSPQITPLSMERVSDAADGSLAASWKSTSSYDSYWGSLGDVNSPDYEDAGVYCGSPSDVLETDRSFTLAPAGGTTICTFLAKFITPGTHGATRIAGIFRGEVGSSTSVGSQTYTGAIAVNQVIHVPADAVAGERYFFAIWEERPFGTDTMDFMNYFTASASTTLGYTAPHGNYVTLPFTYQP